MQRRDPTAYSPHSDEITNQNPILPLPTRHHATHVYLKQLRRPEAQAVLCESGKAELQMKGPLAKQSAHIPGQTADKVQL
jgi:hypothetical protein